MFIYFMMQSFFLIHIFLQQEFVYLFVHVGIYIRRVPAQDGLFVSIGFSWSIAKSLLAYVYCYGIGGKRWILLVEWQAFWRVPANLGMIGLTAV